MALAGEPVHFDVSVLEGDVDEVGVGCDGVGLGLVVDEGGNVLGADLVDVFQAELAVGVVAIDVQQAGLYLDEVAGQTAEAVGHQGEADVGEYGAVADEVESFGFLERGGQVYPAPPKGGLAGGRRNFQQLQCGWVLREIEVRLKLGKKNREKKSFFPQFH